MPDLIETKIDEIAGSIKNFRESYDCRIGELEKRFARADGRGSGTAREPSPGDLLANSEAFQALNGGRARGRASVEMATITSADTTVGAGRSDGTSLVPGMRVPGIVTPATRTMFVRDLIAPGKTGLASLEYVKETGYTNNARPVSESTTIPTSDLTFNLVTSPVRTIAHLFDASLQILADAATLSSYIDVRARYGLADKEDVNSFSVTELSRT
jgi:HK97 family phage major capsid protein